MTLEAEGPLRIGVTPWRVTTTTDPGYGETLARQAEFAEEIGCHSFWLPESHFVDQARPSPLLELAHVAARTAKLILGTTSLLLPIRQPVLVAEEVATLDRLCDGRLILGIGRGFRKPLFRVMGVDPTEKRTLLEHHLETMRRLWKGGAVTAPRMIAEPGDRDVADATRDARGLGSRVSTKLVPLPVQEGGPPIWIAAFGPKALEQAARLELPYLASPLEGTARLGSNYAFLEQRAAELGVAPIARRPVMRTVFIHDDAAITRSVLEALAVESEAWKRTAAPILRRTLDEPIEDRVLVGSPDEVGDRLGQLRDELRVTDVIVRAAVPGASAEASERSLRVLVEMARDV